MLASTSADLLEPATRGDSSGWRTEPSDSPPCRTLTPRTSAAASINRLTAFVAPSFLEGRLTSTRSVPEDGGGSLTEPCGAGSTLAFSLCRMEVCPSPAFVVQGRLGASVATRPSWKGAVPLSWRPAFSEGLGPSGAACRIWNPSSVAVLPRVERGDTRSTSPVSGRLARREASLSACVTLGEAEAL